MTSVGVSYTRSFLNEYKVLSCSTNQRLRQRLNTRPTHSRHTQPEVRGGAGELRTGERPGELLQRTLLLQVALLGGIGDGHCLLRRDTGETRTSVSRHQSREQPATVCLEVSRCAQVSADLLSHGETRRRQRPQEGRCDDRGGRLATTDEAEQAQSEELQHRCELR